MPLDQHPTVVKLRQSLPKVPKGPPDLDTAALRQTCLSLGADDVGFVDVTHPDVAGELPFVEAALPGARTLISFVVRMNRDAIRSPKRSVANLEFHHSGDLSNDVARSICQALSERGARALNPAMGFPMEMDAFPGRTWVVGHKTVALAAGMGAMGIHRCIIHPRFGNFILLGTVITDAVVSDHSAPIDYNPCLECKLCVSACPVGAIKPDGGFDFSACYTHNYREFMSGFTDFTEQVAEARDKHDLRKRVTASESASMWQSLSFGANYKAAYCMAACPAGEDVIGPFLQNRKGFVEQVVRPLQHKPEQVYVVRGSDAEAHVEKRFPHKTVRRVGNGLRSTSAAGFLRALPLVFQRAPSKGQTVRYHFVFRGAEELEGTVLIDDGKLTVTPGLADAPDVRIEADTATWLSFVAKEARLPWALLTGRIRIKGNPKLMKLFAKSFPS